MGAFFFGCLRVGFGTPEDSFDVAAGTEEGACRRELKDEMNSIDCGDSPSKLLKWSAASCFDNVEA
jgi:hypothetical protein